MGCSKADFLLQLQLQQNLLAMHAVCSLPWYLLLFSEIACRFSRNGVLPRELAAQKRLFFQNLSGQDQ